MKIAPSIQNLQQLVDNTTGSENVFGTLLEHPQHGRAVLVDIDRRNNSCTLWYENQTNGNTGFRTILYSLEDHKIVSEPSFDKQKAAMQLLLS
jgi:hypothetical protein